MRRIALLTAALALAASAAPVGASEPVTPAITLDGPSVIHYGTNDYAFEETSRVLKQGRRDAAGDCVFSWSETLQTGQVIDEVDLAYDPTTCRLLVRRGTMLTEREFMSGAAAEDGDGSTTQSATVSDGTSSFGVTALTTRTAYTWSWYDEPARWLLSCDVADGVAQGCLLPPVNSIRNTAQWTSDGTCAVAPGTTATLVEYKNWLTQTGWKVASEQWNRSPSVVSCPAYVYNQSNVNFRNRIFCQAIVDLLPLPIPPLLRPDVDPTNTYYLPSEVRGNANGTSSHYYNLSKTGGCQSFLRSGRRFGSGLG